MEEKYYINLYEISIDEGYKEITSFQQVQDFAKEYNLELVDVLDLMGVEMEIEKETGECSFDEGYGSYESHGACSYTDEIETYRCFGKVIYKYDDKWNVA